MALIILDPDQIIEYIPVSQRKEEAPVTICCKYINRAQFLKYTDKIAHRLRGKSDPEERLEIQRECDREQFCRQVVEVRNVTDAAGNEVTDPGEFYDSVDAELIYEIQDALGRQATLTEGQRKN